MKRTISSMLAAVLLLAAVATSASANVLNMGPGLTSLETVYVGDAGNAADTTGHGAVNYTYNIGKYEVTAAQYCEFLNAVASTDTYGLYNTSMWSNSKGCKIAQSGASGSYTYSVAADWANRPVNYVSWGSAVRFVNWLSNGQPTGSQSLSTTEDGAYYLNGATDRNSLMLVTRKSGWTWALPTEDEWYKAAYYDAAYNTYYKYATGSNTKPSNSVTSPDGGNSANFKIGSTWTIGSPYYRTEVGEFELSKSPYGTFDQSGNVAEFLETVLQDGMMMTRGGAYDQTAYIDKDSRSGFDPSLNFSNQFGFRVVSAVPEPSSILALTTGAIGLFGFGVRRRR